MSHGACGLLELFETLEKGREKVSKSLYGVPDKAIGVARVMRPDPDLPEQLGLQHLVGVPLVVLRIPSSR